MATRLRYVELWCERGQHNYDWPVKRGRKPKSCPAHPAEAGEFKHDGPVQENLRSIIQRVLDSQAKRDISCSCGIRADMSREEITALGSGCRKGNWMSPGFVCPVLDAVRRAIGYDPNT